MRYLICQVNEVNEELVTNFRRLIPQLSIAEPPGLEELEAVISEPGTALFIAKEAQDSGKIVGTLTLITGRAPTGLRAWIEDVVVDTSARGQGIGEELMRAGLQAARAKGAKVVELTSNPKREAANRLYRRLGFVEPETNFYRYYL